VPKRNAVSASRMRIFAAVYLGCRMPDEDRDAIMRIVCDVLPHVQLYQARQSKVGFVLEFDPLTA